MASGKDYLTFVLDQLSGAEEITCRPMMGEFLILCRGKIVGGIYDNRFLVKPTASAERLLPDAPRELPYPGGKAMLLPDVEDKGLLQTLVEAVADDLPEPKKKEKKKR